MRDALRRAGGLPGGTSAGLCKTIWLTRHVQGEDQLIPPKPQWLGRASRNTGKQTYFSPHWRQQQVCVRRGGALTSQKAPSKRSGNRQTPFPPGWEGASPKGWQSEEPGKELHLLPRSPPQQLAPQPKQPPARAPPASRLLAKRSPPAPPVPLLLAAGGHFHTAPEELKKTKTSLEFKRGKMPVCKILS